MSRRPDPYEPTEQAGGQVDPCQREPHRGPLTVRCAVCHVEAQGRLHEVAFAGLGVVRWLQAPAGWWVLLDCSKPHVRCPSCLRAE